MPSSSRARFATGAAALLACLGPTIAHAQTAPAPAPAVHAVLRPNASLIMTGASIFAPLYLASALAAADSYETPDGTVNRRSHLFYPALGPWAVLGTASAGFDVLLVLDGLGQLGGLAMIVYGIATPTKVLVPDERPASRLDLVPLVGHGVSGAALVGAF